MSALTYPWKITLCPLFILYNNRCVCVYECLCVYVVCMCIYIYRYIYKCMHIQRIFCINNKKANVLEKNFAKCCFFLFIISTGTFGVLATNQTQHKVSPFFSLPFSTALYSTCLSSYVKETYTFLVGFSSYFGTIQQQS